MNTPAPTPQPAKKALTIAERDAIHKARNHLGLRTSKVKVLPTWQRR